MCNFQNAVTVCEVRRNEEIFKTKGRYSQPSPHLVNLDSPSANFTAKKVKGNSEAASLDKNSQLYQITTGTQQVTNSQSKPTTRNFNPDQRSKQHDNNK